MIVLPVLALSTALAAEQGPSITVYSSDVDLDLQQFVDMERSGGSPNVWQIPGFGVVKEVRSLSLKPGMNDLRFTDVAAFIDPTTVSFEDLGDSKTTVLEQNFEFDLLSPDKLLEKYVDREIVVAAPSAQTVEQIAGTLLSASQGQLVIRTAQGLRLVPRQGANISLASLPEGLITKPTLVWKIDAASGGDHNVRTTYQTAGLTWRADYNMVLHDDERSADLGAWVTLLNLSGATYHDAQLKLIAGDVQRVTRPSPMRSRGKAYEAGTLAAADAGFEEKPFFEYHLYSLPRRTDIKNGGSQQIVLFPTATDVPVEKVLVVDATADAARWGYGGSPFVDKDMLNPQPVNASVFLRLTNDQRSELGMPLPRGRMRVYKEDTDDGTLEFVGEDRIDHTPKDEKVLIRLGESFDVVAERTQTNFTSDTKRKTIVESIRVNVRNHKDQPQTVLVRETMYRWSGWEIIERSQDFTKSDSRHIEFKVNVPPGQEGVIITYTVRYTW